MQVERDAQLAVYASAVGAGIASHLIFKRYEPSALRFIVLTVLIPITLGICFNHGGLQYSNLHDVHPTPVFQLTSIYLVTLSTSIAIYRLFINPLHHFPGESVAALSKWHAYYIARYGRTHFHLSAQHKKHGDYVRVGPNELSVADANQLGIIHGAKSKFPKGPWYLKNLNEPEPNLFSIQNFEEHRKRRKVWDVAIGTRALQAYGPRIRSCMNELCKQFDILALTGETFDFRKWVELMAFDVMGQVSFGVNFHMLETGKKHMYVEFVHATLNFVASLANIAWVMPIVYMMPLPGNVKAATNAFIVFGKEAFQLRKKQGPREVDVFGFLMKEGEMDAGTNITDDLLEAETRSIIVGGSDTTAVAMNALFYYLLTNRHCYDKLKAEMNRLFQDTPYNTERLSDIKMAPYLNACINEALRLLPPGPNGMQRMVNIPGGIMLDGKHVPEGTKISVHGWSIHHDPRNFDRPWEYIPERWIPGSFEGNHNISAFILFSLGAYQCVGRKLALLEIRMLAHTLLTKFDFQLTPDFDSRAFISKTESYLTLTKSELLMSISKV